jgi:hypothetical protein
MDRQTQAKLILAAVIIVTIALFVGLLSVGSYRHG